MFKLLFVILFGLISADLIGYNRLGNSVNRHRFARNSQTDLNNQIRYWLENSQDADTLKLAKKFKNFMMVRNRRK